MRWSGVALGLVLFATSGASGCKGDEKPTKQAEKAIAASGEIAEEEENLIFRRDSLLSNRKALKQERAALENELREARASGGDTAELDKKAAALREKEEGLDQEENQLNSKLDELLSQRRAITQALANVGGEAGKVAAREAGLAEREKSVAKREDRVAQREAALGTREREVTRYKMEKCGTATPTTIIRTVDAKGSKYRKKDVEPLLKRARKNMSRKGILRSDLPEPAKGLEKEATKAMAEGDYGRARFAAAQLLAAIDSTRINKNFIAEKIGRLSTRMKGRTLKPRTQKEVDKLFREATAAVGDGKFTSANRRLNKIHAKIR